MARRIPWRRNCPDAVKERIELASQARIYLLRETGPTGFLVKEDGIGRKFKVFLGDEHTCTCQTFAKERELCIHILWILLKKFRVPKENQIIFQLSLVEREINEVMRGCYARSSRANKKNPGKDVTTDDREKLKQKEIDAEDVCPICQDEFMQQPEPLTYCKYGCGNSVHIKCMKVWAEHQRSTGETIVKCPLCRVDFGTFQELMDDFHKSSRRNTRAERQDLHLGATCKRCRVCPIAGKCYRCVVCADYHLCHTCFATDTHCQHSFQCRQKPSERWRPATRPTMLPNAVISDLQNREISDGDYDLLLQLDRQVTDQDGIPTHVVQNLPTEVLQERHRFLTEGIKCSICLQGFQRYQSVRTLPCHHPFHVSCIDSWLSNHSHCPVDGSYVGSVITSSHVRQNTRSRTVSGIGEFTIGSSVVGGPIAGKRIGQRARVSRGNGDSVASLPSSFTLSGSGLMVQSKHNRANEVVQFSDHVNTTVEPPLLDGQRFSPSLAIQQNSRRASPVQSAGSGKRATQAGPSSGVNKFTRHDITFGSVNSKPPIPPHSVGNFRGASGDSKRSKSKLTEKMRRISLDATQRSNSEGDLSLFAAGTAVQASEASPGKEHKRGRLVKGKLASQNSRQSLSDPGLAINLEPIMASGISVQLPPVDVD